MNFIKRHRTVFSLGLLLLGDVALSCPPAHAESCELRLGQSELDLGQLRYPGNQAVLDDRQLYPLGLRYVALTASCPSSTRLALLVRGDSLGEQFRFTGNGQLRVRLSNALLDGRAVEIATVRSLGEVSGPAAATLNVTPGEMIVPVSGGLVAQGMVLSLQVEINPGLRLDALKARDQKPLESHLHFEVRPY